MITDIKQLAQGPQSSKKSIANFLLKNLTQIEHFSLEDIAQATYTSKASLVRFAQALGYKGWTDFLPALIAAHYYSKTHYSDLDHNLPFHQDDDSSAIIQKIATIQKESIQDTADTLDSQDLEKAATLLLKADRVIIFGLSPNDYLAQLFRRKLLTLGKTIQVSTASEFGLLSASLTKKDLAIIISYSGNSHNLESLRILPLLKKNQVPILGMTSLEGQILREAANISFTICSRENLSRKIGNFSTEESILFIFNALFAIYFKQDYVANYVKKILLAKDLEENRVRENH